MVNRRDLIDSPERRAISIGEFEVRAFGSSLALEGYASVFDSPYDVYGGPEYGGWSESVNAKAFAKTLREKPDVHLLINHEGMPIARTKSGTLQLSTDSKGLVVSAPSLDLRDPDVQRLQVKMDRGDMDEMSFAFRVKADKWSDDDSERSLTEVSLHKGDVSVVNFGANPATSASIRSIDEALATLLDAELEGAVAELRSSEDGLNRLALVRDKLIEMQHQLAPRKRSTLSIAEVRRVMNGETGL